METAHEPEISMRCDTSHLEHHQDVKGDVQPSQAVSTAAKRTSTTHWLVSRLLERIESRLHTSLEVLPLRNQQVLLIIFNTPLPPRSEQLMALSACDIALSAASRTKRRRASPNPLDARCFYNLFGLHTPPLAVQDPGAPNLHRAIS